MFLVLSSWPRPFRVFARFIWWMQTEHWVAANPQTKPTDGLCIHTATAASVWMHNHIGTSRGPLEQFLAGCCYQVIDDRWLVFFSAACLGEKQPAGPFSTKRQKKYFVQQMVQSSSESQRAQHLPCGWRNGWQSASPVRCPATTFVWQSRGLQEASAVSLHANKHLQLAHFNTAFMWCYNAHIDTWNQDTCYMSGSSCVP